MGRSSKCSVKIRLYKILGFAEKVALFLYSKFFHFHYLRSMILKASNIYKAYGNLPILKGVDLSVNKGEIVSILFFRKLYNLMINCDGFPKKVTDFMCWPIVVQKKGHVEYT